MEPHERVKMLESIGRTYCSYAGEKCAYGHNVKLCAKRNPEECRACRQRNLSAK